MELVKDIYFNTDKLVENTNVKVSYTGKFYQENNDKVFIHYGYGENWNNVNEIEMKKTDLGYQTELNLAGGNTVNFCFKNQNNEWDNNFGKNYIFNIEKTNATNLGKTTVGIKDESNNISGIIEDTVIGTPNSIDTVINTNQANNILENINTVSNVNNEIQTSANLGNSIPSETFSVITPTLDNNSISNALTVVPTGFGKTFLWTQKIKTTVCKFFSYVPKLISGNYKRKVSDNKK